MLKRLNITAEQVAAGAQPASEAVAGKVFRVLHGFYGNLFLSKFSSGVLDAQGRDQGTASAKAVWATALQRFAPDVVGTALDRCQEAHPEYPPSLPQFLALCHAATPVIPFRAPPALPISEELRAKRAAEARILRQNHIAAARAALAGSVQVGTGLDALKLCIANAVAAAGGDEAAELLRLDRMFAREVPA